MSIGEYLIAAFVFLMLGAFVYIGVKLFRYNQKEREEIAKRNEQRKREAGIN